jgi:hypothetical protein
MPINKPEDVFTDEWTKDKKLRCQYIVLKKNEEIYVEKYNCYAIVDLHGQCIKPASEKVMYEYYCHIHAKIEKEKADEYFRIS